MSDITSIVLLSKWKQKALKLLQNTTQQARGSRGKFLSFPIPNPVNALSLRPESTNQAPLGCIWPAGIFLADSALVYTFKLRNTIRNA